MNRNNNNNDNNNQNVSEIFQNRLPPACLIVSKSTKSTQKQEQCVNVKCILYSKCIRDQYLLYTLRSVASCMIKKGNIRINSDSLWKMSK